MNKLFTLLAMAMIAIGVNAQTLIAEKDWTGGFESDSPKFYDENKGSVASDAEGVAITVESQTGQLMYPLIFAFPYYSSASLMLKQDGHYKVVVTAKFPIDGTLMVNMGSTSCTYITASGDFQEVDINLPTFPEAVDTNIGCGLTLSFGDFVGTTILKKVQVYEMEDAVEEIDEVRYFLDKKSKTAEVDKATNIFITKVDIPATITHKGEEYTVTKIMDSAFAGLFNLTSLTIPNGVTSIGHSAFMGCNFKEVTIPASVKVIFPNAFYQCARLERVIVQAETPPVLYEYVFSDYNIALKVPDASIDAYKTAAFWSRFTEFELMSKQKCAKPTISLEDGKLNFNCDTEGVEYHYEMFISVKGDGNGIKLPESLIISVYASKEGLYDSAVETSEIPIPAFADANGDGIVNAADIVTIVNQIMSAK
jgi:hypothetical protein